MWETLSVYFQQDGLIPQTVLWWSSIDVYLSSHFFSSTDGSIIIPVLFTRLLIVAVGTFAGLWIIGRIRKPSFLWAIPLGLITYGIALLIGVFLTMAISGNSDTGWFVVEEYFGSLVHGNYFFFLSDFRPLTDFFASIVTSVIGALAGITLVRWRSPLFCPYCGSRLNPGPEPCKNCGKNSTL
jgi:hypothetical protein